MLKLWNLQEEGAEILLTASGVEHPVVSFSPNAEQYEVIAETYARLFPGRSYEHSPLREDYPENKPEAGKPDLLIPKDGKEPARPDEPKPPLRP